IVGKRLTGKEFGSHIGHAAGLFSPFERSAGGLGVVVLDHVKNRVKASQHGEDRIPVFSKELSVVHGRVCHADQVEDGGAGFGGVQVVGQHGDENLLRRFSGGLESG